MLTVHRSVWDSTSSTTTSGVLLLYKYTLGLICKGSMYAHYTYYMTNVTCGQFGVIRLYRTRKPL